jgi:hypothetical protein
MIIFISFPRLHQNEVSHDRFWKYYYAISRFGICPIALASKNDILLDLCHLYCSRQMQVV